MRVAVVSRVSAHGSPRRGNGITEIAENSIRQALPEPDSTNVHGLDPDLESEIIPEETGDPESPAIIETDFQKEAEINLFSTALFPPEGRP